MGTRPIDVPWCGWWVVGWWVIPERAFRKGTSAMNSSVVVAVQRESFEISCGFMIQTRRLSNDGLIFPRVTFLLSGSFARVDLNYYTCRMIGEIRSSCVRYALNTSCALQLIRSRQSKFAYSLSYVPGMHAARKPEEFVIPVRRFGNYHCKCLHSFVCTTAAVCCLLSNGCKTY